MQHTQKRASFHFVERGCPPVGACWVVCCWFLFLFLLFVCPGFFLKIGQVGSFYFFLTARRAAQLNEQLFDLILHTVDLGLKGRAFARRHTASDNRSRDATSTAKSLHKVQLERVYGMRSNKQQNNAD